jgi:ankyrin repeat protein
MRIIDGRTALMLAAEMGQPDLIKALLERGADINTKEKKHGWTALIYGIRSGDLETVQTLIDAGADINYNDEENASVLELAIILGNPEIVKLLKKAGARD